MPTESKKRLILIMLALSMVISVVGCYLVTRPFTVEYEHYIYPHDYAAAHIFSVDAEGYDIYDVYIDGRLTHQSIPVDWSFAVINFGESSPYPFIEHNVTVVVHDQDGNSQQRTYLVWIDDNDSTNLLHMYDLSERSMVSITVLYCFFLGILAITEFRHVGQLEVALDV